MTKLSDATKKKLITSGLGVVSLAFIMGAIIAAVAPGIQ